MSNATAIILPAVVDIPQVATYLGFSEGGIRVLIAEGELRPLGNPASNAPKYFARMDIEELATDRAWLNRAAKIISRKWKEKNDARKSKRRDDFEMAA